MSIFFGFRYMYIYTTDGTSSLEVRYSEQQTYSSVDTSGDEL